MVPLWKPSHNEDITQFSSDGSLVPPTFSNFSVQELILQGKLLLASSGKEFVKPTGILSSAAEVKKARKEAMGRLGLEFLDGDDMDLDKEFAADAETDEGVEVDVMIGKVESSVNLVTGPFNAKQYMQDEVPRSATPNAPSPSDSTTPSLPDPDATVLSARERNRLKRKRKLGNSAFVSAQAPPQAVGAKYTTVSTGSNNKCVCFFSHVFTSRNIQKGPTHLSGRRSFLCLSNWKSEASCKWGLF